MALIKCKECGAQVSTQAKNCPSCGAKVKKPTSKITWILLGLIIFGIIGAMIGGGNSTQNSSESIKTKNEEVKATPEQVEKKINWQSITSKDEMRGTESVQTYTESTNTVNFEFPYNGGSNLNLVVRKKPNSNDIMINISKGQFLCGIIDGCEVNFKFDDQPIETITFVESDSHDIDLLFVKNANTVQKLITKLEKSKKLIIEPNFFHYGKAQFTFDVEGFKKP